MSAALPDPLEFAADALVASGALVERDGDGFFAMLPPDVARELGTGETCRATRLAPDVPRDDLLFCGLGAPAIEQLSARLEETTPMAVARLDVDPPRATQARALVERFAVRNAPCDRSEIEKHAARYLVVWLAWSAEADDRYDGVLPAAVCLEDLGAPAAGLLDLANPLADSGRFRPAPPGAEGPALRRALSVAAARAEHGLAEPLAAVRALVTRRLRRDHERIAEYFEQMARDALAPRRRIEPAMIDAKLAHLRAERDAKLRALADRYRLRVALAPIALLQLTIPTLLVRLRVRRRKLEGEIRLRLAPGAETFDRTACAACSETTARPAVCDDRLHVLCETCLPTAQGRPSCPACRSPA